MAPFEEILAQRGSWPLPVSVEVRSEALITLEGRVRTVSVCLLPGAGHRLILVNLPTHCHRSGHTFCKLLLLSSLQL